MTEERTPGRTGRAAVVVAVGAILAGTAIRLALVPYLAYDGDDFWTLKWVHRPVLGLLSSYQTGLTMHLYLLAMKGWIALFGASPVAVKLPTVLTGIALLPLTFLLGRRWVGPAPAAVATVLAALSGPLVANAQMARVYPILTLVILLSMRELLRMLDEPSRGSAVRLALLDALALALSLNATIVIATQGVVLLVEAAGDARLRGRAFLETIAAFAGAGVLAALFYAAAIPDILRTSDLATGPHFHLASLAGAFARNHPAFPAAAAVLLLAGAWSVRRRRAGRMVIVWALLPALFYFAQRLRYPEWAIARYLIVHLPAQLLLIGAGLWALARRGLPRLDPRWRIAAASVVPAVAIAATPAARSDLTQVPRPSGKALERIAEIARPGDVVTHDFLPYAFLLELEPQLTERKLSELVYGQEDYPEGRLIVLTFAEPLARERWSADFRVEEIGGPRYRHDLWILVSRESEGGVRPHREALAGFLEGFVDAAAAGAVLDVTPARHFDQLSVAHGLLAGLALQAGDWEGAEEHARLRDEYRKRSEAEWERIV